MFQEPYIKSQRSGWIEVVCGPMFSGKTEELIRRLRRAQIAKLPVQVFKPAIDNRYSEDKVVSHSDIALSATPINDSFELKKAVLEETKVIGIDEIQFLDEGIIKVIESFVLSGKRVIVAGLDMNSNGEPFGVVPSLLAVAEYVTKVHAICQQCGNLATHSYRLPAYDNGNEVEVGAKDKYEPRCRTCFTMGNVIDFSS